LTNFFDRDMLSPLFFTHYSAVAQW